VSRSAAHSRLEWASSVALLLFDIHDALTGLH
jgi:hypothetical protein